MPDKRHRKNQTNAVTDKQRNREIQRHGEDKTGKQEANKYGK
jgi:hypothetical protein